MSASLAANLERARALYDRLMAMDPDAAEEFHRFIRELPTEHIVAVRREIGRLAGTGKRDAP
jgi:hypothetical protein